MFKEVKTGEMDFVAGELEVLRFWKHHRIFEKSLENRKNGKPFVFFEGPPTANGKPHPGHVLTRVIKDVFPRFKTMKGYYVARKGGWDTHGLPVEIEVEKQLGLDGKTEVAKFGVEPFIKKCKESVFVYKDEWERVTNRMGFWLDTDNAYITLDNNYIESVWWGLKKIFDDGLLYYGHKIVPFCPHDQTPLSSHEVAQGYKDVKDPSIFVKFEISPEGAKKLGESVGKVFFIVWTTTPWTLIANVALALNPREEYLLVRQEQQNFILAKALTALLEGEFTVIRSFKGSELAGIAYQPLFPYLPPEKGKRAFVTVCDDFVTMSDGSGIVHIAPAFGEDDYRVHRENGLAFFNPVRVDGTYDSTVTEFAGQFVKTADKEIIRGLRERGLVQKAGQFDHSYPFCWRCNSPLLYYARSAWFIATTKIKDKLVALNQKINWYPEHIRDGRFGNFLDNLVDWAISRERYWGTPLPIWTCSSCDHKICIGSIQELREKGRNVPADIELHKPYIDAVEIPCGKCGKRMNRVPEVIDCWFDSGMMHTAQWHYPFENRDTFKASFPADFISEAVDQTRGWFYSLLATSALVHGDLPFRNCIVIGHVLGKDGHKMSKSKGNVVDTWEVFNNQGADAMRWYFYSVATPWQPRGFFQEAVREVVQNFLGTFKNVYAFFVLYANVDGFNPIKHIARREDYSELDRWILSHYNLLVERVDQSMENYDATTATRLIQDFVDDLSNWYLRRNRKRYWSEGMGGDKIAAYQTLYQVLVGLSRLTAPFIPFFAEILHQNLIRSVHPNGPESVHLCDFPKCQPEWVDRSLVGKMELLKRVVGLGRSARNEAGIKNRQPLRELKIFGLNEADSAIVGENSAIIRDELNLKTLTLLDLEEGGKWVNYDIKPNFRALGKIYGKKVPLIQDYLKKFPNKAELANLFAAKGEHQFQLQGEEITLNAELVQVIPVGREGFNCQIGGGILVALDTHITESLRIEGMAREIINKIQYMRKQANFHIADRIEVAITPYENFAPIYEKFASLIEGETLAKILGSLLQVTVNETWRVNDFELTIAIHNPRLSRAGMGVAEDNYFF